MGDRTIPMFPLSLVLFPGQILPLHIFEDRYRTMVEEIIDKDREFGVVLIERGSEIGGGDTRKNVGTLAEIIESEKSNSMDSTIKESIRIKLLMRILNRGADCLEYNRMNQKMRQA